MASLLWPEADAEAARSRLRRTLHKIRVAFTVDVIEADRTSLALAPSIEARIDAHAFEAACVAGELNEALRLYAGDFLQGLSIDGCAAFEEWAFFRREALRSRLVQALERLIERELVVGDARAAIAAATRLVGLDPLSESAQRHLINAYLQSRRPGRGRTPVRDLWHDAQSLRQRHEGKVAAHLGMVERHPEEEPQRSD